MSDYYISRRLLEKEKYYQYGEYLFGLESSFNLYNLINGGAKRIVLLGDAGYGKSTELKSVALRFIDEQNKDFVPILIEMNTYVDEEIEDYVIKQLHKDSVNILGYEESKLVFLFDEFDQAFNKEKATRKIKQFIEKYNKSTFIVACRTNFYSGQFEDSNIFVILPFNNEEITKYSKSRLKDESEVFLSMLEKLSLFDLSKNPFFLKHLIEIFATDKKLPENGIEILSRFISISLENDVKKLTEFDLREKYPPSEIENDLMHLSLVMEMLQRNFISIEERNKIIHETLKREVIAKLSLIKKSFFKEGDVYQFLHNNFQEYLAAKKLADMSLENILKFISFGPIIKEQLSWIGKIKSYLKYTNVNLFGININKIIPTILDKISYEKIDRIKPSWVNTVSFLCQLREKDDLLDYLMKNEPELSLKFEGDRIEHKKKEKIFKYIFGKYTLKEIPIDRDINYEELANFAKSAGDRSVEIFNYLMNFASLTKHHIYRYNAIQMLGRMEGFNNKLLGNLLIKHANNENENESVRFLCFQALTWLNMASQDTIDALKHLKDSDNEWVLAGLYDLIKESEYTEQCIDILLSGIPRMRKHMNASSSHLTDLSWNLKQGIEKISSPAGVKKIIEYLISSPNDLREYHIENAMEKIIDNTIAAYNLDKSIYDHVKKLFVIVSKKHIEKSIHNLHRFFYNTGNIFKFFEELYKEGIKQNYRLLASIADEQCVEFLIDEYKAGNITDDDMWGVIWGLSLKNRDIYERLLKIINDKTGKFYPPPVRDFEKERKDKLKRKVEILFNRDEFLKEIKKIFDGIGKDFISFEELDDIFNKNDEEETYNDFVVLELWNHFSTDKIKETSYADLKDEIDKWNYDLFTIPRIYNLLNDGSEIELSTEKISVIKNYCLKNLDSINFNKALEVSKDERVSTTASYTAIFLWYFLRKYDFDYPEGVLLDMLSFDWIEGHEYIGIDYLEKKLPPKKIKQRILENLSNGIEIDRILKNHLTYCQKHQIREAIPSLHKVINDDTVNIDNRLLALDMVAIYQESRFLIKQLLDSNEINLFMKAAEILTKQHNENINKKLRQKLSSNNDSLALEAARILIEKQDLKAIQFYTDYIKRTKKFNRDMRYGDLLPKINNIKALPILLDLLKFSFENSKEIEQDDFGRLDSTVIVALKNIARRNYSNFIKVRKSLLKFINKYNSLYENINTLNYYCNDIEKDFFINFKKQITVDEAIKMVNSIV